MSRSPVDSACSYGCSESGWFERLHRPHGGAAGLQRAYLQVLDLADLDHIALVAQEILPAARSW